MPNPNEVDEMYVVKRNNNREIISFDKILRRVKKLCNENKITINSSSLVMKVIDQLHNDIHTSKIDELTAQQCTMLSTTNPDYGKLASFITISNHHKNTSDDFNFGASRIAS